MPNTTINLYKLRGLQLQVHAMKDEQRTELKLSSKPLPLSSADAALDKNSTVYISSCNALLSDTA